MKKRLILFVMVSFLLTKGGNYMLELIKPTDTLAEGYPKINVAIQKADQAFVVADNAVDTANNALAVANQSLANSQSTQEQLNQIVIDGDSSVEAAQARVNADNTKTYDTLKERLDSEYTELKSQLADIAAQEYTIELERFGIYNDGTHAQETIDGINAAITWAKANGYSNIYIPDGTYLIYADADEKNRINVPSNTKIRLSTNAIIQVETNSNPVYCVFQIKQAENVTIEGGQVIGDKATHTYVGGEYQYLISIWGSENVTIKDMKLSESPCLGIRVQEYVGAEVKFSRNVRIYDNEIFNIASCGIAIEGAIGLWIENNEIHDVYGYSIEQGIDIEGHMISEAYVSNNNLYNNGKGDILVYIPSVTPATNAENIFIKDNRCTKKIWIECANNATPIKVHDNTVNNPNTTGDISAVDFALYARGKNIHLTNNIAHGHVRLYDLEDSEVDGLYVRGESLVISECVNSTFNDIEYHSTLYAYKNFNINKCTNTTFNTLKLESCYMVLEGDNKGIEFNDVDSYNFTGIALEVYGSGLAAGNEYTFNNLTLRDRPAEIASKLISVGSQYITLTINNISVKNIKSTGNLEFEVANNSTLVINGGELSDFNRLDTGNSGSIARKMVLKGLYLKTTKTSTPILVAQGDTKLIVSHCLFECNGSVVAIKTDTATANSVISQNIFLGCTIATKAEDTAENNTVA